MPILQRSATASLERFSQYLVSELSAQKYFVFVLRERGCPRVPNMYMYMYVCVCICMYKYVYVFICICMYVCMYELIVLVLFIIH